MGWLLEDLLGVTGDGECLQGQVTRALACRHCISITCLQSPGNLMIIFLFMIWQIRRWWQLRRWQQLQLRYSGDLMQGKGLQLLHYLDFFDHLWKQNSEEEEESEEEKEEESSLGPLKPHSPSSGVPIGNQDTTAPQQPSHSSERLTETTGSPEQIFTQPSNSFRSFPTFQILTNLPVRNTTSRSSLKQENTQFFWGLPSLHSESLEMIFLNSCGSSPLKSSVCPSVFNKVAFLPMYNLLFSCYHCPTHYHTSEAQTMEDLEGMLSGSQLVPSPSSPASPSLSFHVKSLPEDCKGVLSDAGSHAQWLIPQREIPCVSDDQTLYPLPELQRIRPFTLLNSSEVWREMSWDPNFHQHNPTSPSTCLLYPSSSQSILTKFKVPRMTMRQNEHPKTSESVTPTPSPGPAFLPECKTVNPVDLSRSKALWEVTEQKESPHISEPSVLAPCQSIVLMAESQGTGPPGIPFGYETQWGTIEHKENPLMSAARQLSESLSELQVNPKRGLSAPEDFWETVGYTQNPQVAKSPVPVPCPHLDSMSDLQKESPLEDLSLCKPWWQCRENSGHCWAAESPTLNLSIPACASSASETGWKCRQSTKNSWDSADPVSSPNLSSVSVVMGSQLEPKASCKTKEQREKFWASNSPDPAHETPLVPFIESQRINTMDGFPRSEATWKDTENSRNSWVSESLSLALSPSPSFELEPHRVSHTEELLSSHIPFRDNQRKNSLASEFPAHRLPQHLHEAYHPGVLVDPQPVAGDMKQKKNSCVPFLPVWNPSSPLHSVSKSHLSEPLRDLQNSKGEVVEQRKDFWATELPAPTSVSAPSQEPHTNLEVVFKNAQETEASQGPNSPVVNSLHPTPWSPMLAKALKFDSIHPSHPQKEEAEPPSSQTEPVPEVIAYPETHAWQWSKELKFRLKKLHQNLAFKSSGQSPSYSSSFVLNSTPDPWEISSCPPLHTHPISLHPYSSSCHHKKVQSTVLQPAQDLYVTHSSSQSPLPVFGRAEQKPQVKQRLKGKIVAQIPSPGGIHIGAGKNSLGMGEPSTAGVLASCKRKDKVSPPKKASPRKPKAGECGGGDARMGSSTVIGKSHSAQTWRPAEAPVSKFSKRSYRDQSSVHTALPQQGLLKGTGAHNERRVRLIVGDVQHLHHCKHCPLAHMERHLPSSTSQAPLNSFQRVLAKFLGTHRPLSTKSS